MKTLSFILAVLAATAQASDYVVTGTLHLTDGTTLVCDDIRLYARYYSKGGIASQAGFRQGPSHTFTLMKADDNRKIELSDKSLSNLSLMEYGNSWADGTMMDVHLKNGNSASMFVEGNSLGSKVHVTCADSFTGKSQRQTLNWGVKHKEKKPKVVSIAFGESGNLKWSGGSNRFFPVGFKYDPYTGELLKLKDTMLK